MPVLNLPPAMGGMPPQLQGMAPAGPPGGLPPALPSILMPKQMGFPVRAHMRVPKPKKATGKMLPPTVKAVKAKAKKILASY